MGKRTLKPAILIICVFILAVVVGSAFFIVPASEDALPFKEKPATERKFQNNGWICQMVEARAFVAAKPATRNQAQGHTVSSNILYIGIEPFIAATMMSFVVLIYQYTRRTKIESMLSCRFSHAPPISC